MVRGIRSQAHLGIRIWGPSLLFPQAIGGLYFINRLEGVVVLVGLIVMLATVGYIHRHAPMSRLIGVGQAWWLLTAPWLLHQAMNLETLTVFSVWLWYVTITMIISLLMDAYGFHMYLTSENKSYREED